MDGWMDGYRRKWTDPFIAKENATFCHCGAVAAAAAKIDQSMDRSVTQPIMDGMWHFLRFYLETVETNPFSLLSAQSSFDTTQRKNC